MENAVATVPQTETEMDNAEDFGARVFGWMIDRPAAPYVRVPLSSITRHTLADEE